ncbi:MAG: hypothetical protein ACXADY_07985 [Candidatus Hodarchaeales archaeon]
MLASTYTVIIETFGYSSYRIIPKCQLQKSELLRYMGRINEALEITEHVLKESERLTEQPPQRAQVNQMLLNND